MASNLLILLHFFLFIVRPCSYLLSVERAEDELEVLSPVLCHLAVVPLDRDASVASPSHRDDLSFRAVVVSVPYESDDLHHAHLRMSFPVLPMLL